MIQFINPIFLAIGIFVSGILIVIRLLNSRVNQKLDFGTTRLILQAQRVSQKRRQFKKNLLFLIRILILLGLAVAFSKPSWTQRPIASNFSSYRNVIVLVDCSYSMGIKVNKEKDLFAILKSSVGSALQELTTSDRSALVSFSNYAKQEKRLDENHQLTQATLDSLQISSRGTNLLRALQLAEDLLQKTTSGTREIWIASDQQKVGWEQFLAAKNKIKGDMTRQLTVKFIPNGTVEKPANLAITDLNIEQQNHRTVIQVPIRNFGSVQQESIVRLFLNETLIDSQVANVSPQQVVNSQFSIQVKTKKNQHTGYVEIIDQSVQADNRRYFCLRPNSPIIIHLLDQTNSEMFYVQSALNSMSSILSVFYTTDRQLPSHLSSRYSVVMMHEAQMTELEQSTLHRFVTQGGQLLIAAGISPLPKPTNLLSELYPCEFSPDLVKLPKMLTQIDFSHPIFRSQQQYQGDFAQIHFEALRACFPKPSARVIASFEDGTPLLVEHTVGLGRVIFFNSRIDRQTTDFPVRSIYLPFLHSLISYLGSAQAKNITIPSQIVSDSIDLKSILKNVKNVNQEVLICDPSGQEHRLVTRKNQYAYFQTIELAGIYKISTNGFNDEKWTNFAVNIDTVESDLTAYTKEDVLDLIKKRYKTDILIKPNDNTQATLGQGLELEKNKEIWWFVLVGVLLLALIDTWLSNYQ